MMRRYFLSFLIWLVLNVLVVLGMVVLPLKRNFVVGATPRGLSLIICVWICVSLVACYAINRALQTVLR